jgi:hypothetical protein
MTDETEEAKSETSPIDRDGGRARDGWDQSSPPSAAIVDAIAEATERDPTALPPLYRSVDSDALDTLLTRGMQRGEHVHVSFTYDGVRVSVGSDGNLSIRANGTAHEPTTTAPETSADLETALEEVLRLASRNGVSVTGGYGVRNGPELPDWDVHITQVNKPKDEESRTR